MSSLSDLSTSEDLGVPRLAFDLSSNFGDISLSGSSGIAAFSQTLAEVSAAPVVAMSAAVSAPNEIMFAGAAFLRLSADLGSFGFDSAGMFGLHAGSLFGPDLQLA